MVVIVVPKMVVIVVPKMVVMIDTKMVVNKEDVFNNKVLTKHI